MCNPVAIMAAGALKATGDLAAGKAASNAANAQAKALMFQRRDALDSGNTAMENQYLKGQQVAGAQRAAMGAGGFDTGSGSNAQVQMDTAKTNETDIQTLRHNALMQAWGYQQQANMAKQQGKTALISSYFSAAGDLMGSSGSASKAGTTVSANGTKSFSWW